MAQIIRKSSSLSDKHQHYRSLAITGGIVSGVSFLSFAAFVVMLQMFFLAPFLMIGFLGGAVFAGYMAQKSNTLASGLAGETMTAAIVASLPQSYCGFQNVQITYDGKTSELDMVVVGPTGVFIIETKNLNGTVQGNYDDPQWTQHKIGRQGTPYSKQFYSPVKQVGTHTYRLANHLRAHGLQVYVNSMVYFSNPDTMVQMNGAPKKIPVYTAMQGGQSAICGAIMNSEQRLSPEIVNRIAMLLNNQTR